MSALFSTSPKVTVLVEFSLSKMNILRKDLLLLARDVSNLILRIYFRIIVENTKHTGKCVYKACLLICVAKAKYSLYSLNELSALVQLLQSEPVPGSQR